MVKMSIMVKVFICLSALSIIAAFQTFSFRTISRNAIIRISSSEEKTSFWDLLNGNAAVKKAKAANPTLFQRNAEVKTKRKTPNVKITPVIQCAVDIYKKENPQSQKLADQELAFAFTTLSKVLQTETDALQAVKNYPDVLAVPPSKFAAIIDIFEGKWGYEKAKGVVIRNPSLFNVPVTGYGSAETAAEETIFISYLINATRPIGKPLLLTLFLLLLKPVLAPYLGLD